MQNDQRPGDARKPLLDGIASLTMIAASVILVWVALTRPGESTPTPAPSEPKLPKDLLSLMDVAMIGDDKAAVAILEFSDFECPFCAAFFQTTLPTIRDKYITPGKVKFAFRHLPLEQIHSAAFRAAEAAECARRQGAFWQMHDALFSTPKNLEMQQVEGHAKKVGLDRVKWSRCLGGEATSSVRDDVELARNLSIDGTPAFFIGTVNGKNQLKAERRIDGAAPFAEFVGALDKLIASTAREPQ